jgi:hypothetical protein
MKTLDQWPKKSLLLLDLMSRRFGDKNCAENKIMPLPLFAAPKDGFW